MTQKKFKILVVEDEIPMREAFMNFALSTKNKLIKRSMSIVIESIRMAFCRGRIWSKKGSMSILGMIGEELRCRYDREPLLIVKQSHCQREGQHRILVVVGLW